MVYSDASGDPTLTVTNLPIGTVTAISGFNHEVYIDIASFQYRDNKFTANTERVIGYDTNNGVLYELRNVSIGFLPNTGTSASVLLGANVVDWTKPVTYQAFADTALQTTEFPYIGNTATEFVESTMRQSVGSETEFVVTSNFNAATLIGRVSIT